MKPKDSTVLRISDTIYSEQLALIAKAQKRAQNNVLKRNSR